jgi:HEAT repeat protein/S1-C subfamily serine protease
MARMTCPDCQTVAKLDAIPASGKVFCSGCGRQFRIKDSGPASPSGPVPVARAVPTNPSRGVPIAKAQVVPSADDDEVIDLSTKSVSSKPLPVAKAIIVEPDPPQRSSSSSSSNVRPPRSYGDDDRPRKLKKKKKSGSSVGIWVAAVSGAVLVIAGLSVMLWVALRDPNKGEKVVVPPNAAAIAAVNKKAQQNEPSSRDDEGGGEPVTPPWRNESGGKSGGGGASNDAPANNNPTPDNGESSLQPTNFGGASEGGGADVYPYVLKSAVFILSLMKDHQHIAAGSGSLIDKKNRLVLTNHHVAGDVAESVAFFPNYDKNGKLIAERERFALQFRNRRDLEKKVIYAKVLAANQHIDLCLLQLSSLPPGVEALPVAKNSCRVGQRVHSVGNPGTSGALWVYAPGVVRQVYHRKWRVRDPLDGSISDFDADIVETQSPTNHGDSGGPLVNDRGELVGVTQGVVASQGTQLSLFIDLAEVRKFVESTVQNQLQISWSPDARLPLNISAGGGMMAGNLTDLVKALSSADSKQKTKAAETLGELGDKAKDAIPSLLKLLSDPDDFTKRTALSALVKIGLPNKADVPLFANSLREPSVELRRYAASTLEKMGPDARNAAPDLVAALGDNDPLVRQAVARALGKMGRDVKDNAARPLELLMNDSNKDNRLAAAEGLSNLYAATSDLEALRKLLKHQDADLRPFAASALAKMGKNAKPALPELLEMAKSDTGELRRATMQVLSVVDPIDAKPGLSMVIESLSSGDTPTKLAALAALGTLAKEAPATVVNSVKEMTKDHEMKRAAITALAKLGTVQKTAVTALAEMLKEGDDDSKDAATKAIIDLGPAAVPAVTEFIKLMEVPGRVVYEEDRAKIDKYAGILAKIGKPAIPALRRNLSNRSVTIHWGCAKALGEMGPIAREAVRDLQALLAQEPNSFVRDDIEEAIRKILNQ